MYWVSVWVALVLVVLGWLGCTPEKKWTEPVLVQPVTVSTYGSTWTVDMEANDRMWRQIKAVGGQDDRWLKTCHKKAPRLRDMHDCIWQHYLEHGRPLIARAPVRVVPGRSTW